MTMLVFVIKRYQRVKIFLENLRNCGIRYDISYCDKLPTYLRIKIHILEARFYSDIDIPTYAPQSYVERSPHHILLSNTRIYIHKYISTHHPIHFIYVTVA